MIVSVFYHVGPGQKFDDDYYLKTHMKLVHDRWGPVGLKGAQVMRGTGSPSGDLAHYHIVTLLDFTSLEAFHTALEKHGKELMGDIPNFTNGTPTIQFNEVLA